MPQRTLARVVNVLLVMLLAATVFLLAGFKPDAEAHVYGRDFLQFYTAGSIVNHGAADRLYDQAYFRSLQEPFVGEGHGFYSCYPPTLALAMAPLAWLSYEAALGIWWSLQTICFLGTGWLLWKTIDVAKPWRGTAMLALATLYPVSLTFMYGHLTALLLIILTGGLMVHHRGNRLVGGVLLSMLALKPHFALAVLLWLLLRRDRRTLLGMLVGMMGQAVVVSACLGPAVLVNYVENLPVIARIVQNFRYSAVFEQSLAGMVGNLIRWLGYRQQDFGGLCLLIQTAVAAWAGFMLFRIHRTNTASEDTASGAGDAWRNEQAAVVLFVLMLTPYLLVYDLTLLVVPIVHLWSTSQWRYGIALYLCATLILALVYLQIGFSFVPFLALLILCRLAGPLRSSRGLTDGQPCGRDHLPFPSG